MTRFNLTYTYTIRKGYETAIASDLWQSIRREFNFKSCHSLILHVLNERNNLVQYAITKLLSVVWRDSMTVNKPGSLQDSSDLVQTAILCSEVQLIFTFTELLKTFKYSTMTHEPINFRAITRSESVPTHAKRQTSSLIWSTVLTWL